MASDRAFYWRILGNKNGYVNARIEWTTTLLFAKIKWFADVNSKPANIFLWKIRVSKKKSYETDENNQEIRVGFEKKLNCEDKILEKGFVKTRSLFFGKIWNEKIKNYRLK